MAALAAEVYTPSRPATADELEAAMFELNMKDRWSVEDSKQYSEWARQLTAIRQQQKNTRAAA